MSSSSGRSSRSSACSSRGYSESSFDADELLLFGSTRMELRKEKDLLSKSQPHSLELVRRLELHSKSLSESRLQDTARIRTMEIELLNCYKEIGYLRDQLIFKSKEVSYLNEHVHTLESNLAESGNLEDQVKFLREELCMSKSEHLLLLQELESKETELQSSSLSVEKLEETISSLTLESLCEIESMKLDITALEQALGDAMKIQEESIQEKDHLKGIIEEVRFQFQEAQEKLDLSRNVTLTDEEAMRKQIQMQEDLVKRLKEELKEEKLKAKEEAEELTQEMAELRYKMTCLLDEERKRRVCVEQASLQRIAELEAQLKIKRETKRHSSTELLPLSGL